MCHLLLLAFLFNAAGDAHPWVFLITPCGLLLFAAGYVRYLVQSSRRGKLLARLAAERHLFLWMFNRWSPGLDFTGTPLAEGRISLSNHYEGVHAGFNFCLFDYDYWIGRTCFMRSAVAVLVPLHRSGWDTAVPGLSVHRVGSWIVFTRKPRGFGEYLTHFGMIPVPELAAALDALCTHLDRLTMGR